MIIITEKDPTYSKSPVPDFQGNPLIECLQPYPLNNNEAFDRLIRLPEFNESELELPRELRAFLPSRLRNYMHPTPECLEILKKTYIQVYRGYRYRNPMTTYGQQLLYNDDNSSSLITAICEPGTISFITGLSGMGKSRAIESVLNAFGPTVVLHSSYQNTSISETQIVFIKRNVPEHSTPKRFSKHFGEHADSLLGTEMYEKYFRDKSLTQGDYISELHKILKNHHVGALVIDELQNLLLGAKKNKDDLIAHIINLRDEVGVPIILVGTYKAVNILRGNA